MGKNGKATAAMMSANELKELFRLQADTMSNTYEMMCLYKGQAAGAGDREGGPEGRGGEAAKRGKGGKRGAGRGGAAKRRGEEEDEAEEEEEEQEEQDVVQVLDADNEASEAAAVGAAVGAAAEVATSGDHGMAAEPDAASGQPSEATAAMLPVFKVQVSLPRPCGTPRIAIWSRLLNQAEPLHPPEGRGQYCQQTTAVVQRYCCCSASQNWLFCMGKMSCLCIPCRIGSSSTPERPVIAT